MGKLGYKHTKEAIERIRLSKLGKKRPPFSQEWCHKLTLSRIGDKNPMFGKKHLEKSKKKMSLIRIGKVPWNKEIKLPQISGINNPNWKGGKRNLKGYIQIYSPEHFYSTKQGYILEHRLVMEKYLGRLLKPKEIVHHIDNNTSNNKIKNLMLFPNNSAHLNYHRQMVK